MTELLLSVSEVSPSVLSTGRENLRRSQEYMLPVFSWVSITGMTKIVLYSWCLKATVKCPGIYSHLVAAPWNNFLSSSCRILVDFITLQLCEVLAFSDCWLQAAFKP